MSKTFVYNFPDGLSVGIHALDGVWTNADGVEFTPPGCAIEFLDQTL